MNEEGDFINNLALERHKQRGETLEIPLKEQLAFFMPLGMTSLLISITHTLFNAGLSKLPTPEVFIAAFAVAKSLMQILQNPVAMVRQTITSLVHDEESYIKVRQFVILVVTAVVGIFSILAFTPLSRLIFQNIMGVQDNVLEASITILRVLVLFPAAVTLRSVMQGLAIKFHKTYLVTIATVARVLFVVLFVGVIQWLSFIPSAILAGMMFLGAITAEGITMYIGVKRAVCNIPATLEKLKQPREKKLQKQVNYSLIFSFYLPLLMTSFIRALARPIINGGLARTDQPAIALSAYAVAWGLGMIIVGPLMMFHQVPIYFIEEGQPLTRTSVKKFAIYLGIVLSGLIAMIAFSPMGHFILREWIGVTVEIRRMAMDVLKIMSLLPLVMVIRQYYWGILMKFHRTKVIGKGKVINLISLALSILVMTLFQPENPAIIGVVGMIVSEGCESLYLYKMSQ